jgi:hypothetical protein
MGMGRDYPQNRREWHYARSCTGDLPALIVPIRDLLEPKHEDIGIALYQYYCIWNELWVSVEEQMREIRGVLHH